MTAVEPRKLLNGLMGLLSASLLLLVTSNVGMAANAKPKKAPQAAGQVTIEERVNYQGAPNCIRMSNGTVELILTTDYGPRILRYAPVKRRESDNILGITPTVSAKTELGEWFIRGGHRLWHAPEEKPRTYVPDNARVAATIMGNTVKLVQGVEVATGIQKEIWVTLDATGSHVTLTHRLTNRGFFAIDFAAWALTVMAPGGLAIVPQEPYRAHADDLLPARPMVLWSYTNLKDPRWNLGQKYVTLRQDKRLSEAQKAGFFNKQGWCAYHLNDLMFVKKFAADATRVYPDYNSNNEIFTNDLFLELESLGPMERVESGQTITHTEHWWLYTGIDIGTGEAGIAAVMLPIISEIDKVKVTR